MEGDPKTGAINTSYHGSSKGDGILQFRNPDTGNQIEWVTFNSGGGGTKPWTTGGYWMTNIGANAWLTFFARNTGSATIEAFAASVQLNLCINCHDANGASNANVWATGGTAYQPFGGGWMSPSNVKTEFWSTATYHPVMKRQNNSFADKDTLTMWNSFDKGTASNTKFGDLMTCWDCHDSSLTGRTIGGSIQAGSHGYSTIVRAAYDAVAKKSTSFCDVCHKNSVYWGTTGVVASNGVAYTHFLNNNVSAMVADSPVAQWAAGQYHDVNGGTSYYTGCTVCHGATNFSGAVIPSPRGPNIHGSNTLHSGAATWTGGTGPYSFLRNTLNWADWNQSTRTCDMNGATNKCRGTTGVYTPGGSY